MIVVRSIFARVSRTANFYQMVIRLLRPWYKVSGMVIYPDFVTIITLRHCHFTWQYTAQLTLYGLALTSRAISTVRDSGLILPTILPFYVLLILSGFLNFCCDSLPYNRVVYTLLREVLELWFVTQDYVLEGAERVVGGWARSKSSRLDKLCVLVAVLLTHATHNGQQQRIVVTYVQAGELRPW